MNNQNAIVNYTYYKILYNEYKNNEYKNNEYKNNEYKNNDQEGGVITIENIVIQAFTNMVKIDYKITNSILKIKYKSDYVSEIFENPHSERVYKLNNIVSYMYNDIYYDNNKIQIRVKDQIKQPYKLENQLDTNDIVIKYIKLETNTFISIILFLFLRYYWCIILYINKDITKIQKILTKLNNDTKILLTFDKETDEKKLRRKFVIENIFKILEKYELHNYLYYNIYDFNTLNDFNISDDFNTLNDFNISDDFDYLRDLNNYIDNLLIYINIDVHVLNNLNQMLDEINDPILDPNIINMKDNLIIIMLTNFCNLLRK